jgi:hypothetical protein
MKRPGYLLKAVTVISSVLLVAGFIAYRAGAFDWLVGNDDAEPERFMSSSKFQTLFFGLSEKTKEQPGATPQLDPAFMSSSKSIILVSPAKTKDVPAGSPSPKPSP